MVLVKRRMPIPEWACGSPHVASTRFMAWPISRRSRLVRERMSCSRSSVTVILNEIFDVPGELVERAFLAGFLDLAMNSFLEA